MQIVVAVKDSREPIKVGMAMTFSIGTYPSFMMEIPYGSVADKVISSLTRWVVVLLVMACHRKDSHEASAPRRSNPMMWPGLP
jgi:hypothetical protein